MDCRIDVNFPDHPKTVALKKTHGKLGELAVVHLWLWAARCCPEGVIRNMEPEDIGRIIDYEGDPKSLLDRLVEIRLLERADNGNLVIHDWNTHNLFVATAPIRKISAQKAANARWSKRRESKRNQEPNADRICGSQKGAYAPSPSPSPNKKEKEVFGEFENVHLTTPEYGKLKKRFGEELVLAKIEKLSQYKASKGKKYKDDYATILSWDRNPKE